MVELVVVAVVVVVCTALLWENKSIY